MKKRWWAAIAVAVIASVRVRFCSSRSPGPARELDLVGDVSRGDYLIRWAAAWPAIPMRKMAVPICPEALGWNAVRHLCAAQYHLGPRGGDRRLDPGRVCRRHEQWHGAGGHLYPAFPYENYTLMSDQEIADLYAALMATEPVATPAAQSQIPFPFNILSGHGRMAEPVLFAQSLRARRRAVRGL